MGVVINPGTAAATYPSNVNDPLRIDSGEAWQFTGFGFSGADVITLQVLTSDGTYADYVDSTGATITLSSSCNSRHVLGPFVGRWSKGVTGGSVGLRAYRGKPYT